MMEYIFKLQNCILHSVIMADFFFLMADFYVISILNEHILIYNSIC